MGRTLLALMIVAAGMPATMRAQSPNGRPPQAVAQAQSSAAQAREQQLQTELDLAKQLIAEIADFKRKNKCDRLVMIWAASTEIFMKPHAVHRDPGQIGDEYRAGGFQRRWIDRLGCA